MTQTMGFDRRDALDKESNAARRHPCGSMGEPRAVLRPRRTQRAGGVDSLPRLTVNRNAPADTGPKASTCTRGKAPRYVSHVVKRKNGSAWTANPERIRHHEAWAVPMRVHVASLQRRTPSRRPTYRAVGPLRRAPCCGRAHKELYAETGRRGQPDTGPLSVSL